ncbi:MAG: hypothetical protein R3F65_30505 [bacterium]
MPRPFRPHPGELRVWLYTPQILALLAHLELDPPETMSGAQAAVLARATTRLVAAANARTPPSPLDEHLERLADTVLDIRSAEARELIAARVRALTTVAVLWSSAEQLAPGPDRDRLLDLAAIDGTSWPADVLDALDAGRMRVHLPGDPEPADWAEDLD